MPPARLNVGLALPGAARPAQAQLLARRAEAAGCAAIWVLDVRREPYLQAAAAISATNRVSVGTNVAVAFARSPTVTAAAAWDLSIWSGGRFVLGLGSQVGPTLAARYGTEADHPAPRIKDYIGAVRSCFEAFASGYGRHQGDFYTLRRPAFQPGAEPDVAAPPIYLAAVNPLMTETAGECADGLAAHPFTTADYLTGVTRPALQRGAERASRPPPPILLQLVVAPDRPTAASQMTAYTVPAYRRVLDEAGLGPQADAVMAALREGRRSEARDLVDQHYLDRLGVIYENDLKAGIARWAPLADRLSLSVPWYGLDASQQQVAAERLVAAVANL